MPIRMRCSTAADVRKASISIRLFSMRRALRSRLCAADVVLHGSGIATYSFHERRIYETLETECDRMCHVVDLRRSIVCSVTNWNKFIGSDEFRAGRIDHRPGGRSGKFVRRVNRDSALGLRKLTKCSACTLLRYVGYGSLGLREELLPE